MATNSTYSGANAGALKFRNYANIRGVDFSDRHDEVSMYRSPDMLNLWKNYRNSNGICLETRPDLDLIKEYEQTIYGLFFFTYENEKHTITHVGTNLYDNDDVIYESMAEHKSIFFVYGTNLYIMDSESYLVYDGVTVSEVEGYIPTTTISRQPIGGGEVYQDINLLTPWRKNSFCSDGESLEYHLDVESYDEDEPVQIWVDDELVDNSEEVQVTDKNGYLKYKDSSDYYWYDEENETIYNTDYDEIVDGTFQNDKGYVKYKDSEGTYYYYDSTYDAVYDTDGNEVDIEVSTLTKLTTSITISSLTNVTDYPYTEDPTTGIITFSSPPAEPLTDGADNVVVLFKRTVEGYRERIENCTIVELFDNRVFYSGNPNYPCVLWHCSLEDPSYCSDVDYYEEGVNDSAVKGIVAGNNAVWVLKEPSQTNTTIFYHNPSTDSDYGKIYPSSHSSISTGCLGGSTNFRDTIIFFSDKGMEGISSDVTTEQVITHMSSLVDNKLLNETNYKDMSLVEWQGYLLVAIDNHVYLADSSATCTNNDHTEYEWFYWEFDTNIDHLLVDNEVLYVISDNKMYTLTNNESDRAVTAYFTTLDDEFDYPQMQKITNKRGCVADVDGDTIDIYVKTDKTEYEKVKTYTITKRRITAKIKRKKWKMISLKLTSDKPFYFYSVTLESYITNYLKK